MFTLMLALVLWAPQTIVKCNGKLHPQGCAVSDSNPEPPMTCDGNLIHQECHYPEWFLSKKPEPMDVPALRIPIGDGGYPACIWTGDDNRMEIETCWDTSGKPKEHATPHDKSFVQWKWTCADKSRILMTAEDGTRHCLKFPKD